MESWGFAVLLATLASAAAAGVTTGEAEGEVPKVPGTKLSTKQWHWLHMLLQRVWQNKIWPEKPGVMRWSQLTGRETIMTFVFWLSVFPSDCQVTQQILQLSGCCVLQFDLVIWSFFRNHLGGAEICHVPKTIGPITDLLGRFSGCPRCHVFLSYLHVKRKTLPLLTICHALVSRVVLGTESFKWFGFGACILSKKICVWWS